MSGYSIATLSVYLKEARHLFFEYVSKRVVVFRPRSEISKWIPEEFSQMYPNCLFRIDGYERQVFRSKSDSISNKANYNAYYGELGVHCLLVDTPDRLVAGVTAFYPGSSSEFKHLFELSNIPLVFLAYQRDRMPEELSNLDFSNLELNTIHELRKKLKDEGKLIGICLGDGAFTYSAMGSWQYMITPQLLPRDGSASTDASMAKTVAKHRAGIEHLVGKFKQAEACVEAFRPSEVEKQQYNVFIRAALINLSQMLRNGWKIQEIKSYLMRTKDKFFLDPFVNSDLSQSERAAFKPTPLHEISRETKRILSKINNCPLTIDHLVKKLNMTFANFKRGSILAKSGHLNKMDYCCDANDNIILRAFVFAGYLNREHMVVLAMQPCNLVTNYYCTCTHSNACNIMCTHVVCVLIKILQYQTAASYSSNAKYNINAKKINESFQTAFECTNAFKIVNEKKYLRIIQSDTKFLKLRNHMAAARNCTSVKLEKYSHLMGIISIIQSQFLTN